MATDIQSELQRFHEFVAHQLKNHGVNMSPEQALAMWRERAEAIASAQRGLDDLEAGRVRPADEVLKGLGREGG